MNQCVVNLLGLERQPFLRRLQAGKINLQPMSQGRDKCYGMIGPPKASINCGGNIEQVMEEVISLVIELAAAIICRCRARG